MSNDPLLGLDSPVPQSESKWAEVPKKRSGGWAEPLRFNVVEKETGRIVNTITVDDPVAAAKLSLPVMPGIEVSDPPELHLPQPIPLAYKVEKPSLFQRFLDWLLL